MNKTKLMRYPVLITIIGEILMLLLPYASSMEDYEERLMKYEDEMYDKCLLPNIIKNAVIWI